MRIVEITPYLKLPLKAAPIVLVAVFSGLLAFASRAGLFGIPLALILLSWFFKYAFVLLDATTDGVREPPVLSLDMVNPASEQRSLVLLLLVVGLFFVSDAAEYWLGPLLGTLTAVVLTLLLPAIIGVQGATGSLLQSLNVHRCLRLIGKLGSDYALIVLCAGLLLASASWVMQTAALPLIVRLAFAMYACLAVFAVIGGVLYERRDDIGLEAAHAPERQEAKVEKDTDRERDRHMDLIYAEWRSGAHANACKTISALLEKSTDPGVELEWLYEKAASWPDPRLANQLAQAWLPHLLNSRHNGRVLDLLRERLRVDPNFRPTTSDELLRCVRLARDGGERKIARMLLLGFAEHYPNDPLHTVAQSLTAQLES